MTTDKATAVAFDHAAPQAERTDALGQLQKAHAPTSLSGLILPREDLREVISHISNEWADSQMNKALNANIVPFPSKYSREKRPGMQSVNLDHLQITAHGDYWEKPSVFGFDAMRAMVTQTPILNAVVLTRIRQVQAFCRINESGEGPGFAIRHIDKEHQITGSEKESIRLLQRFVLNCGWEFNPRERKKLKRDSMTQFMAKLTRDSLTMDAAPIETEMKRDKSKGIDGLYAVDGATIRLCTENGYQGDDELFALQVVQGRISAAYTHDDLIYEARNPQSDVLCSGYGLGETELLIRVVTGFLNAMTLNIKGFDSNAIPKGMLHLSGGYTEEDLTAFKRYWNSMTKGVNNAWAMPVMVSKDQESKASFENFGVDFNEMYFSKWMTFLTSIICAIYGMSPAEINFDSFSGGNTSPLAGSDTDAKLAASKDSGLRPLLAYFEGVLSDYVVSDFSDKYVFRWTGLDDSESEKREERARLVLTVNEMRAQEGLGKLDGPLGDAPLNPSLTGIWMQLQQAQQPQDFGQAPEGDGGQQGAQQEQGDDAQNGNEAQADAQQEPNGAETDAQQPLNGDAAVAVPAPSDGQGQPEASDKSIPIEDALSQKSAPLAKSVMSIGLPVIHSLGLPGDE
jgi:hypothetical protein